MASNNRGSRSTEESSSSSNNERKIHKQKYDSYELNRNEQLGGDAPDLVLDVPSLNIDEIDLEVDDLRAQISASAELADFVRIHIGVDVRLGKAKLGVKGVEAQALLEVKLRRVLDTLNRALEVIDRNPQVLGDVIQDPDQAVAGASPDVNETSWETSQGGDVTTWPAEGHADDQGRIIDQAWDEYENIAEEVTRKAGDASEPNVSERSNDREAEDVGVVDATEAAERKSRELGIQLSDVRGTGSGGRILVRDVEKVAKG